MKRAKRLVRRFIQARKLGFTFIGVSRTKVPNSVRLNSREVAISYPSDGGYLYDLVDVWLDDEYGLRGISLKPEVIVDIGANIGLFTLWAWHNFPNAQIHSYEPNPRVLSFTEKNINPTGASVYPFAVSDKAGVCSLSDNSQSRMAALSEEEPGDIKVVSFEEVVQQVGGRIDLLKIDCEGGEWSIFSEPSHFTAVNLIRMEYHLVRGKTLSDLKGAANDMNFELLRVIDHDNFGIAWLKNRSVG